MVIEFNEDNILDLSVPTEQDLGPAIKLPSGRVTHLQTRSKITVEGQVRAHRVQRLIAESSEMTHEDVAFERISEMMRMVIPDLTDDEILQLTGEHQRLISEYYLKKSEELESTGSG